MVELLSPYGDVIPQIGYTQFYDPAIREGVVNDTLSVLDSLGLRPEGMNHFQMDSYVVNYTRSLGLSYNIGYCYDQDLIDWVTTRGALPMPYYASESDCLIPSNNSGLLILPWFTFDYVDSFNLDHRWCSHPLTI
jgi:hypothetical protein